MNHNHLWPITTTCDTAGHLWIAGCNTVALAQAHGTPLYLLDEATFRANCRAYREGFARGYRGPSGIQYSAKALFNTTVAQLAADEGLGIDVVSGGELFVALRAGVVPAQIHLHGNVKPQAELEAALSAGIGCIIIDTLDELDVLAQLTAGRSAPQPIMLRVAPDVAAGGHAHITTGAADSKFGLPLAALDAAVARVLAAPGLRLVGLHAHLGSMIFAHTPFERGIAVLLDCAAHLRERHGITLEELSPGGGLGVPYTAEQQLPDVAAYAAALGRAVTDGCMQRNLPLPRLIIEPGRSIAARAGVALYQVVATKRWLEADHPASGAADQSPAGYIHIDGGMADNIRPALYGARYTALLANRAAADPTERVHVAGRFCESGDVLLRDVALPQAQVGDLLAVAAVGAYTLSMASNYNLVPRPALLLLNQGHARLIERRETYADLVRREA